MHEFGMVEGIIEAVARRAAGRPVAALGVRVTASHAVVPEVFLQAFEMAAQGTLAEGAEVEVVVDPVSACCTDCEATFPADDRIATCPECGGVGVPLPESEEELVLEWLRYADSDGTPTAAEPTPTSTLER